MLAATEERVRQGPSSNELMNILVEHNMKEAHLLYPEYDDFLSDEERIEVVKKAQLT